MTPDLKKLLGIDERQSYRLTQLIAETNTPSSESCWVYNPRTLQRLIG